MTIQSHEHYREIVYTPESQLHRPWQLFKSMFADLFASRGLAWRLFLRNISAQYRQSLLGYVWAFLPPLATTATFVFLNTQKILNVGTTGIPYPAYVMTGTLLWQGFVDALRSPLKLVISSKSMLAKVNFPREALILAGLEEVLFNFSIRLVLLIGVFGWFRISIPMTVIFAPIGIMALIALGFLIGIFLVPLGVLYKDIEQGLLVMVPLWFFMTPVVYPVPTQWPASLLAHINPVSPLIITTREMLLSGKLTQLGIFLVVITLVVMFMFVGWLIYRLAMPHLIERIGI